MSEEGTKEVEETEEEVTTIDVKELDMPSLLALYQFVTIEANQVFGDNRKGMKVVTSKQAEIKEEIYKRLYGCNPFRLGKKYGVINGERVTEEE